MPVRLKGFHFINAPPFMDRILALIKPFLKKSFNEMLHVHTSPNESVYQYIPKEMFPKENGGNADTFEKCRSKL